MKSKNSVPDIIFLSRIGMLLIVLLVLIFGASQAFHTVSVEVKASDTRELSFKSVPVTNQDTLWSIAKENYSSEYQSIQEYIEEIKRCNSLSSDEIRAGSFLLVPYYTHSETAKNL
ncbi:MAG: LysM peptidoglycan-binding domain-containing protein [Clostridiaceae bacterium]|nr:LysM peptidoglycan-binding domain-containing protein [Clostridiaceae bacterium]